jgi:hypothetical protein
MAGGGALAGRGAAARSVLWTRGGQHRRAGLVLAVGLVAAGLACVLRFWLTPALAKSAAVPAVVSVQSSGSITTLLDFEPGQEGRPATPEPIPVTHSSITTADPIATEQARSQGADVSVTTTLDQIVTADGRLIAQTTMTLAARRDTQELADCCGTEISGAAVPVAGLGSPLRFPWFADEAPRSILDPNLLAPAELTFVGRDRVDGLQALKFQQATQATPLGTVPVPGALVGSEQPSVRLTRMRSANRTLWVDGTTGIILRSSERVRETLRDDEGGDVLTLLAMNLATTPEQDAAQASRARAEGRSVRLAHTNAPALLLAVGLGFVAWGATGLLVVARATRVSWHFPDEAATFDDLRY